MGDVRAFSSRMSARARSPCTNQGQRLDAVLELGIRRFSIESASRNDAILSIKDNWETRLPEGRSTYDGTRLVRIELGSLRRGSTLIERVYYYKGTAGNEYLSRFTAEGVRRIDDDTFERTLLKELTYSGARNAEFVSRSYIFNPIMNTTSVVTFANRETKTTRVFTAYLSNGNTDVSNFVFPASDTTGNMVFSNAEMESGKRVSRNVYDEQERLLERRVADPNAPGVHLLYALKMSYTSDDKTPNKTTLLFLKGARGSVKDVEFVYEDRQYAQEVAQTGAQNENWTIKRTFGGPAGKEAKQSDETFHTLTTFEGPTGQEQKTSVYTYTNRVPPDGDVRRGDWDEWTRFEEHPSGGMTSTTFKRGTRKNAVKRVEKFEGPRGAFRKRKTIEFDLTRRLGSWEPEYRTETTFEGPSQQERITAAFVYWYSFSEPQLIEHRTYYEPLDVYDRVKREQFINHDLDTVVVETFPLDSTISKTVLVYKRNADDDALTNMEGRTPLQPSQVAALENGVYMEVEPND